jgi:hypothetical protein
VIDPLFWLGLSILLVSMSLTAVLVVALPTFIELRRAAQSADKLFTTLERDFPPTLEAIRLTGIEISELSEDLDEGVKSAGSVVKQVDQSLNTVKQQASNVQVGTRSFVAGVKAAWRTWKQPLTPHTPNLPLASRPPLETPLGTSVESEKRGQEIK